MTVTTYKACPQCNLTDDPDNLSEVKLIDYVHGDKVVGHDYACIKCGYVFEDSYNTEKEYERENDEADS